MCILLQFEGCKTLHGVLHPSQNLYLDFHFGIFDVEADWNLLVFEGFYDKVKAILKLKRYHLLILWVKFIKFD